MKYGNNLHIQLPQTNQHNGITMLPMQHKTLMLHNKIDDCFFIFFFCTAISINVRNNKKFNPPYDIMAYPLLYRMYTALLNYYVNVRRSNIRAVA